MSGTPSMARRRTTGDGDDVEKLIVEEEDEPESHQTSSSSSSSTSSAIRMDVNGPTEESRATSAGSPRVKDELHLTPPPRVRTLWRRLQSKKCQLLCWWVTVVVLGVFCVLAVAVPLGIWENRPKQKCLDFEDIGEEEYEEFPYLFAAGDSAFTLCKRGELKLEGTLGKGRASVREDKVDYWLYTHDSSLNITRSNGNCLRIEWEGESSIDAPLTDCFSLGDAKWYGAYEVYNQIWPITGDNMSNFSMTPFLPGDYLAADNQEVFGSILHPLWLNSNGTGILVDRDVHLHVSFNADSGEICLHALPFELECVPHSSNFTLLRYSICIFDSLADTVELFYANVTHPGTIPEREIFQMPIWSTWAHFGTAINGSSLIAYLTDITQTYGFSISQFEIDDGYSKEYGDLSFDSGITNSDLQVLADNVSLTAWVHPFVNIRADTFLERADQSYFLPGPPDAKINSISLIKWWHDHGAVVNFLHNLTAERHHQALDAFVTSNHLISLKFDAGEVTYIPKCTHIEGLTHPTDYTDAYVRFVGRQSYSSRAEVRVGYFTQDVPVFVRLLDRNSRWDSNNGLQSVLTAVLAVGLAGYPFILPDMIGGNAYPSGVAGGSGSGPSPELFVRWVQLNAFLPAMQFSIPPWNFDEDVVKHTQEMVKLHTSLSGTIINFASQSANTNLPIVRPIWWLVNCVDSEIREIWDVADQFLIGNDIMVAPVLQPSVTTRLVYFPRGTRWRRRGWPAKGDDEVIVYGEKSPQSFAVPLYETLYFERVNSTSNREPC